MPVYGKKCALLRINLCLENTEAFIQCEVKIRKRRHLILLFNAAFQPACPVRRPRVVRMHAVCDVCFGCYISFDRVQLLDEYLVDLYGLFV
jgi:hypothetical protein